MPPVPLQNFLMRNTEVAKTNADDRRRSDGFRAKDAAGRKVKGRGAMVNMKSNKMLLYQTSL